MKKTIRQLPEIKANNSNRILREYVLRKAKGIKDCSIFSLAVKKECILDYLFDVQNKLYNYLCGMLLSNLTVDTDKLIIIVDKKHTNTLIRDDFDSYIKEKLKEKSKNLKVEIFHKHSHDSKELQVVDFVAWSIFRKFNSGDDFYHNIIEEKIANKENMLLWK